MRRFGSDQFSTNFSPRYQGMSKHQHGQAPYSHIQVIPKVDSSAQGENVSPQVTFRRPSYSEEAASGITSTTRPLPPKPAASLANMALGTTFAAKARAAELNAVRNSKAAAKENEGTENVTSMAPASMGAVKLKPRTRSRGWKTLDLEEIPETSPEINQQFSHQASTAKTSIPSVPNQSRYSDTFGAQHSSQLVLPQTHQSQPRQTIPAQRLPHHASVVQQASAIPRFVNDMATQNIGLNAEHLRFKLDQLNQMAVQHNFRHLHSGLPTFQAAAQSNPQLSTQRSKVSEDDPFVEMRAAFAQSNLQERQPHQSVEATTSSSHDAQPLQSATQGAMNHEFKFPTEQPQRRNLPYPPGLPRPSTHINSSPGNQDRNSVRQTAPTADTHQRDPKPYTSYLRSSDDSSENGKGKAANRSQLGVGSSASYEKLAPSTRTVLYDPIAQISNSSTVLHHRAASQSGEEFLKASEPLPWKNRPVDIYTMTSSASLAPHLREIEEATATVANDGGSDVNAYVRSLTAERTPQQESSEQRLSSAEAWWNHDGRGRGQEQARAYLEHVANEHQKLKQGGEYENIKRAMERQASFRDDRSDDSNATTVPNPPPAGDVINRLMVPVLTNLRSYVDESSPSYFNKFSKTPAWAVDSSADGNRSFFGEDWGKPPPRVGRDPRYRPTFHDGRYTVFEPTDGRVSGRGW